MFLLLSLNNSLYILCNGPLSDMSFANNLSFGNIYIYNFRGVVGL